MKGFKIHLIRHGISEGSNDGKYIGRMDVDLTEEGRKQLKNIMSNESFSYPDVEAVISSPLKRCVETAKIIYPDHNPLIIDDLAEYDFGEFDGKTADELKDSDEFKEWIKGNGDAFAPHGESNNEFLKRVYLCFKKIVDGIEKSGFRSVAIVTHGGVIMTIMEYFALPECSMHEWLMPNGHGYTLNFNSRIWNLMTKIEASGQVPIVDSDYNDEEVNIYF